MSDNISKKLNTKYYVHSVVCVCLMIIVGLFPTFGEITPMGMKVLSIFIGMIYGWIFVGFIWPSLLGMLLLGMSEALTVTEVFSEAFGNNIVLQVLFAFIFVATLDISGLTKFIAKWCVSRRICIGRPWVFTTLFFIACYFVAGLINLYGGVIILWSIFYSICGEAGFKKGDAYIAYVLVATVFIGSLGALSLPIMPIAIVYNGLVTNQVPGYDIPALALSVGGLLIVTFFVLMYLFVGKYALKIDLSRLANHIEKISNANTIKINKEQKICIYTLIVFVVIIAIPLIVTKGNISSTMSNLGVIGACSICLVIQCFRRDEEGNVIYNFNELMHVGVNWDLVILIASTMPLCAAMEMDEVGIVNTIIDFLMPVLSGTSPVLFIGMCVTIFWLVTQITHNLILCIVFMPVLANIGTTLGIDPYVFCLLFGMATQCAIMTPAASAQAAMVFGNTEWVTTKDTYKFCFLNAVIGLIAILFVGFLLMKL